MDLAKAVQIQWQACGRKFRYRSIADARQDSVVRNKGGHHYRCPFCSGHHVSGSPPSMETLQAVADAIRALAQAEVA